MEHAAAAKGPSPYLKCSPQRVMIGRLDGPLSGPPCTGPAGGAEKLQHRLCPIGLLEQIVCAEGGIQDPQISPRAAPLLLLRPCCRCRRYARSRLLVQCQVAAQGPSSQVRLHLMRESCAFSSHESSV